MKRVHCLYRVSTLGQVDKATDDIPMQKLECTRFAANQGWTITREFSEKGVSGFKVSSEDRDAIQELKVAAVNGEFDILLVFMFDRLGRRDDETPFVVEWFVKQGIEVWSTQEGEQRFDTHVDKLMNYIRYWQSSGESIKTSIRIKTRMEQMVQEGSYTGGTISFGYQLVKRGRVNKKGIEVGDLVINPTEAEIVKLIFEKTIKEGLGSHRVATFLNDQAIRTHKGSKFQSMTINRILRNRLYCGYVSNKRATSQHISELQIIDQNTFDRAQEILEQRMRDYDQERTVALNTKGTTLLSGNIFCGHCGTRMVTSKYNAHYVRKDGSEYNVSRDKYVCGKKVHKSAECSGSTCYLSGTVDLAVDDVLRQYFESIKETPQEKAIEQKYRAKIAACNSNKKKLTIENDKLTKRLQKLNMEIANALVGESNFSPDQLSEAIKVVQAQLEDINTQLAQTTKELSDKKESMSKIGYYYDQFRSWADEFENASDEERKMIAGQLIYKVRVFKGYKIEIEFNMGYQQFCG